jgi:hypothetical protein
MQPAQPQLLWFPPPLPSLSALGSFSALELERIIPVPQAANINNQHEDTFRRNFPHLIRKIGKRKTGVKLRDAITLPAPA